VTRCAAGRVLGPLLVEKFLARQSGIVTGQRDRLKRLFCLVDGHLAFAASNLVEEQFPEYLVREGLLQPADRASAGQKAAQEGTRFTSILIADGLAGVEQLRQALAAHIELLLGSCLEWPEAGLRFEAGTPKLDDELTVRLSPIPLLLAHASRHPASDEAVRARVGNPSLRLAQVPSRAALVEEYEPGQAILRVLHAAGGSTTLGELLAACPQNDTAKLRALHALLLVGAVAPAADEEPATRGPLRERPASRQEILDRLARIEGSDHYAVLGLTRSASAAQVREAYYHLAKRLHPDRFRTGELQDLLPSIELLFSRVTEAYNSLADATLRRQYDEGLDLAAQRETAAPSAQDAAFLARQNFLRARELMARRRFHEALRFLENAAKLDPARAEYELQLGLLRSRNPRMRAEAETSLRRAVQLEPTSTAGYVALGDLYARAGRNDEAAAMYREALRWNPDHRAAAERLAALQGTRPGGVFRGLFRGQG
jgi:tetratricopeptide (TPR) repeat protein